MLELVMDRGTLFGIGKCINRGVIDRYRKCSVMGLAVLAGMDR
jgi:predicted glycoside hydrolase/deacetylase ChbG (UPF0249 family)